MSGTPGPVVDAELGVESATESDVELGVESATESE
jgi:hypothetical protein